MSRRTGVAALVELLRAIYATVADDFDASPDDDLEDDATDYAQLAELVDASLRANLLEHASDEHREGYLRGLAVLFADVSASSLHPGMRDGSWNPLAQSARAFEARSAAARVCRRGRR
jgi:hypothetical protein